ncbi:MAG: DtxR family transcriptional regulator [Deltaproteobacteria bacterium]|nr:DtxR family transcriptional regulator [Deltaproteobacteria bacterium]
MEGSMEALTPSLEDYLEAMWTLSLKDKVVRVRDIAASLGVTTPSVVGAVKSLVAKNLARHERYGYVELTDRGSVKAREVEERHRLLFSLLHDLLGIDQKTAYQEACKIEHHLSNESVLKIKRFVQFFEERQEEKALLAARMKQPADKEEMRVIKEKSQSITLGDLEPGEKGHVVKIRGPGRLRKRLLDMGMIPGTEVQLKKVAPLGDPVDILIKGYHLSLRKEEAEGILITRGGKAS